MNDIKKFKNFKKGDPNEENLLPAVSDLIHSLKNGGIPPKDIYEAIVYFSRNITEDSFKSLCKDVEKISFDKNCRCIDLLKINRYGPKQQ